MRLSRSQVLTQSWPYYYIVYESFCSSQDSPLDLLFCMLCLLLLGLFYTTVSPCLLVFVRRVPMPGPASFETLWPPFAIFPFPSTSCGPPQVIFPYYLGGVRWILALFSRPLTFLRLTLRKNGIINSLVHLLLSGPNCVFVYIILWVGKNL